MCTGIFRCVPWNCRHLFTEGSDVPAPTQPRGEAKRAQQIFQTLRQETEADLRGLAELLASKEDGQILGATEFEVRDRVHKIGAKAIETALNERKKGDIKGRALSCSTVTRRLARRLPPQGHALVCFRADLDPRRAYYHCGVPWPSGPLPRR